MKKLCLMAYAFLTFSLPLSSFVYAETLIRDVVIDLEADGRVTAFNNQDSWEGVVGIEDIELTTGDTLILRISFSNGKGLKLSNPGINPLNSGLELTKLTLIPDTTLGNDWRTSGTYRYSVVEGDILSNPTEWDINGGGGAYQGPFNTFNLTDTSFTYNGIDIVINIDSYTCWPDYIPCVFDKMEWSSSAEDVQIVDAPTRKLAASIDITPGRDTRCNESIPVAILGNETLDVTQIDPTTLSFEGLYVQERKNGALSCSVKDVNSDGYADFVCRYQDATTEATLRGQLLDGTLFEGADISCVLSGP